MGTTDYEREVLMLRRAQLFASVLFIILTLIRITRYE